MSRRPSLFTGLPEAARLPAWPSLDDLEEVNVELRVVAGRRFVGEPFVAESEVDRSRRGAGCYVPRFR